MRSVRMAVAVSFGLSLVLASLIGFSMQQPQPAYAAPFFASAANDMPIIGLNTVLYDGALGTAPGSQGFTFFPGTAGQVVGSGGVTLTTINAQQDGYSRIVPTLNLTNGFSLRFSAQILSEDHTTSGTADKNGDGIGDRAGFSVIAISSDGQNGLEVAFWEDEIWVQEDGAAQPPPNTNTLFTHGEGVTFDTKSNLVDYELVMSDTLYSLLANGTEILSGTLRNYSAFSGFPNPYVIPNYVFFGDDTSSAAATVYLTNIAVLFNTSLPNHTTDAGQPLIIPNLGGFDIDAGGDDVVLTITVNSGVLSVSDGVANGLNSSQINGNGTAEVVLTAPIGAINTTLAFSPSLTYTANIGFGGVDTATLILNDLGHNGPGNALIDTKSFTIEVQTSAACFASLGLTTNYASTDAQAVRDAVAAASPGETVKVAGNCVGVQVYNGMTQTVYISQPLTIQGGYTITDWVNSFPLTQTTTLDAQSGGRVAFITATGHVTLENMIITNGNIDGNGGGIYSYNDLTLRNVKIFSNTAIANFGLGGGICVDNALTLIDVEVFGNTAPAGAAGGVLANGIATIIDSRVEQNSSLFSSGGIGTNADLILSNTMVLNNVSGTGGGVTSLGAITVTGGHFEFNIATNDFAGGLLADTTLNLSGTAFIGNSAQNQGGAIYIGGTGGGESRVINALLANNTSTSNQGAGLYLAAWDSGSSLDIIHTSISGLVVDNGQAVYIKDGTVNITNTIIASYTTGIEQVGGTVREDYNLFFGNTTNLSGTISSGGNSIVGNPAFTDPANNDYHLAAGSAAIDTGTNAGVKSDFENDLRPLGNGYDIGYDESNLSGTADLHITKTVTPDTVLAGEVITYTLIFTNNGLHPAVGVVITDDIPITITNVSHINSGAAITPTGSISYVWAVENLQGGEGGIITITGQISSALSNVNIFTNMAEITTTSIDTDTTNNISMVTTTAIPKADLEAHKKRLGTGNVTAGEQITYTITITNNGSSTVFAVVTDTFTGSVTNVTDDVSGGGNCSNSGASPIICNFANFTGTEVITLVMTTDNSFSGTLTNTAEIDFGAGVTAIDPITGNNSASVNVTVATFDLAITKSSVRDSDVSPNGVIYYTVTVNNNGPVAAPGATISDSLPASVGGFTWTCTASGGATCANSGGSGNLSETIGPFPAGGRLQYLITATLSVSNTTITNTATVTSPGDSTPGNNSATDINQAGDAHIYLPLILKSSA